MTIRDRVLLGLVWLFALTSGVPAFAQVDLSGAWSAQYHEDREHRIPGPALGDYTGIPLNDAARLKADSWDASILTLREHQAKPHPSTYSLRGPANIRIRAEVDPATQQLVAYEIFGTFGQATRMIWMDGRPHPPAHAAHTWAGFSTGAWDGPMLTVSTTHLKVGWLQRNGVAHSDRATMVEHFIRHGDRLTVVTIVDDPVYLEEPFIRTTDLVLNLNQEFRRTPFDVVDEIAGRERGYVPHYLPGSPGALLKRSEFSSRYGMAEAGARGGKATTYPEFLSGATAAASAPAPGSGGASASTDAATDVPTGIQVLHVQGGVHMLVGAGGNIAVQVGEDGVLVVDTGLGRVTDEVLAAVRGLSSKPIRIVVNTHMHPDHTSGNQAMAEVGEWLGTNAPGNFGIPGIDLPGPRIIAHEHVLRRMSGSDAVAAGLPTETFFAADKELFFNEEAVQLLHQPGHTDGDLLVFFRRSDVIATGDLFVTTSYPVIDVPNGGSVQGVIDGLNRILDLAIPKDPAEGGTYVIPGHGRLSDEADVVEYRDMLTIVRDRVRELVRQGMTLDEVLSARPTMDYDGRYGAESVNWTVEMFIEALFQELRASPLAR